MSFPRGPATLGAIPLLGWLVVLAGALVAGRVAVEAAGMGYPSLVVIAGAGMCAAALMFPIFGLGAVIALIPVAALLAESGASFATVALGLSTAAGYAIQQLDPARRTEPQRMGMVHLIAGLFVVWIVLSDPAAALGSGDRNWAATYVQLWLLMYLTSRLLNTPSRRVLILGAFTASAVVSLVGGALGSPEQPDPYGLAGTPRFAGLAEGSNSAARIFAVGLAVCLFILVRKGPLIWRAVSLAAAATLTVGAFSTLSRTGLLLTTMVPFIVIFVGPGRFRKAGMRVAVAAIVAGLLFVPGAFSKIEESRSDEETSTITTRVDLWRSGMNMWRSQPVTGVGVGRFSDELPRHGVQELPWRLRTLGPHSAYVGILAENGLPGLLLFLGLAFVALTRLRASSDDETAHAWWAVLAVMLLGAITKHDQYDKLMWMSFGAAAAFPVKDELIARTRPRLRSSALHEA